MKKFLKIALVAIGIVITAYVIFVIVAVSLIFEDSGKPCNAYIMEEYYNSHQERITALIDYYRTISNANHATEIEFDGKKIARFHITDKKVRYGKWDPDRHFVDSLLNHIGWSRDQLDSLRLKLKNAGCISITGDSHSTTVGFRRVNMGIYSFIIYDAPFSDEEQKKINDNCLDLRIFYTDCVAFEYVGGVLGAQTFPGKEEYVQNKKVCD